jgi:hypothetical protein
LERKIDQSVRPSAILTTHCENLRFTMVAILELFHAAGFVASGP